MIFLVIGKIFVFRFQHAEISSILFRHPAILSKKNAVLVFLEKLPGHSRLTANLCYYSAELYYYIGQGIHQLAQLAQVIGIPAKVSGNESSFRMFFEHAMLFFNK